MEDCCAGHQEFDFNCPAIFALDKDALLRRPSASRRRCEQLLVKLKKDDPEGKMGRTKKDFPENSVEHAEVDQCLAKFIPCAKQTVIRFLANADRDISDANFRSQSFVMWGGFNGASIEKYNMSCFRLAFAGIRTVVMADAADVCDFMMARGEGTPKSLNTAAHFMKCASAAKLSELADSTKVYHASVGPFETLFVPYGFAIVESVCGDTDVLGVRLPFLVPSMKLSVEKVKRCLEGMGDSKVVQDSNVELHLGCMPIMPIREVMPEAKRRRLATKGPAEPWIGTTRKAGLKFNT